MGSYGVRGWVRVQSFTDPPEALLQHRQWRVRRAGVEAAPERTLQLREARYDGHAMRVAFEGIEDRSAADALRGAQILVERAALPRPGEREYYREDLLGFEVRNREGVLLGRLAYFLSAPAGAVMVVRGERDYAVPAAPPHLRRVDLQRAQIEVDWPADF